MPHADALEYSLNTLALAAELEALRFECRLRELSFFTPSSNEPRIARVAATLEALTAGRYVIGLGPNCGDVIRVGRHPIRLGRHAGVLEESSQGVIDYAINDASIVGPREVSRLHATLDPTQCPSDEIQLRDEESSTGTWLYPTMTRVQAANPSMLRHGSLFSLGPSTTNLFVVIVRD